jgi:hypothetical protein
VSIGPWGNDDATYGACFVVTTAGVMTLEVVTPRTPIETGAENAAARELDCRGTPLESGTMEKSTMTEPALMELITTRSAVTRNPDDAAAGRARVSTSACR